MNARVPKWVSDMREGGWEFDYSPDTSFISARHPMGGHQSVCEVVNPWNRNEIGEYLASVLNGRAALTSEGK